MPSRAPQVQNRSTARPVELILLVDASRDCRYVVRTVLEYVGFHVVEAEDGPTGLRLARELTPDLILTEFPVPVPGYSSLTAAVRADPALTDIPVLSVTAHALDAFREQAWREGASGFLTKPIEPRRVLEEVRRLLSGL